MLTSRPGKVYQTAVAAVPKPNEISHFTRAADGGSATCVAQFSARQPAPSRQCSLQEHCPEHVTGGRQLAQMAAALLLLCLTSRRSQVCGVTVWIFLGDLLQMCEHLSKRFTNQGQSWGMHSVIRFLSHILGKVARYINVLKLIEKFPLRWNAMPSYGLC